MALVNGTNFDHIDLQATAGGDTTRHMLQDTQARNDITDVRSALLEKAQIDGYYEGMTVGNAEQLIATVGVQDKVPYNFRTSGGSIEIGDREVDKIIGGTVAWNQLISNGNFVDTTGWTRMAATTVGEPIAENNILSFEILKGSADVTRGIYQKITDVPQGHVVLLSFDMREPNAQLRIIVGFSSDATIPENDRYLARNLTGEFSRESTCIKLESDVSYLCIGSRSSTSSIEGTITVGMRNFNVFDLTQMFGATIADYINTLETATPGAGVAWFRALFPKDYYAYDAGTLRSIQTSAHKMVGFNAYDNETGKALVIGGSEYEITGTYTTISMDGETITPVDGKFTPARSGELTVTGGDGTTCIHLRWDGERDGEFEPYTAHTYPLDNSLELRGAPMLDANNKLYYDGDEYESDGTVTRKYRVIDLGDWSWTYYPATETTIAYFITETIGGFSRIALASDRYKPIANVTMNAFAQSATNLAISSNSNAGISARRIMVRDDAYSDVESFVAAVAGIKVLVLRNASYYITESAAPYQNPQIVDEFGTEQYIDAGNRDVEIPVGHDTIYRQNLRAKLETAPNSPNSSGDYLMRRSNGQNSYVPYASPLPTLPAEDGTYTLKCTVSGGTAALSWEAET